MSDHTFQILTKRPDRMLRWFEGAKLRLVPWLREIQPKGADYDGGWLSRWIKYDAN